MATERVKLTRRIVEAAPIGPKERFVWDTMVVGFGLRLRPGGHRGYIVQYRFGGQTRRYQIGVHGAPWTVETARDQARVILGKVADGEDPQELKFLDRKSLTVAQLCDLYLAEGMVTRKDSSIAAARNRIDNHIKPILGPKRAALVTRQDVEKLLMVVAEGRTARRARTKKARGLSRVRGGRGAANGAVVTFSAVMGFGVARGVRDGNPAFRVRRFPEKKLKRFLSPAEFGRLGEALAAAEALGVESPYVVAAIRLLILSGCRKGEVLTLKHTYVDAYHRCLLLPDSKTGEKVVHLGAAAMRVIEGVEPIPGNPYLFPGRDGVGRLVNLQKPWERIRAAAGLDDVRIHDLRHAFASLGIGGGESMKVIGALLGHRSAKTTEIYAHLADSPVKAAAERIAQEGAALLGLDAGAPPPPPAHTEADAAQAEAAAARAASVLGEVRRTRWLDTPAAAALLGNTVGTLQTWRWMGVGPTFRKIGRRVVYGEADLKSWAEREAPTPPSVAVAGEPVSGPNLVVLAERRKRATP